MADTVKWRPSRKGSARRCDTIGTRAVGTCGCVTTASAAPAAAPATVEPSGVLIAKMYAAAAVVHDCSALDDNDSDCVSNAFQLTVIEEGASENEDNGVGADQERTQHCVATDDALAAELPHRVAALEQQVLQLRQTALDAEVAVVTEKAVWHLLACKMITMENVMTSERSVLTQSMADECKQLRREICKKSAKLSEVETTLSDARASLKGANARADKVEEDRRDALNKVDVAEEKFAKSDGLRSELQKRFDAAAAEVVTLKKQLNEQTVAKAASDAQVLEANAKLANLRERAKKQSEVNNSRYAEWKHKLDAANAKCSELREELSHVTKEKLALQTTQIEATQSENIDLKRRLAMTDADNAALKRRVAELEAPPAVDPKALIAELEGEVCRAAEALCAQHVQLQPRQFAASPVMRHSSGVHEFIKTLLAHGVNSTLVKSSGNLDLGKFELRFHGTTVDSVQRIFVDGFDPSLRRGQVHGPGEYFGDFATACGYDKGAMLVVLLFTAAPGIVSKAQGGAIVVVNNPTDRSATYCVALGTFADSAATQQIVRGLQAHVANVTASTVVPRAVHFRDDSGKWAPADPAVGHAVAVAQARGATTGKCVVGQFSYTIDLAAKTQTNDHTGKVRALHIA